MTRSRRRGTGSMGSSPAGQTSKQKVESYVAGSWGPTASSLLLDRDGRAWHTDDYDMTRTSFRDEARGLRLRRSALPSCCTKRLANNGDASLVVSGGTTPRQCLAALAESRLDWPRVQVALSDERWVPPDHDDSNEKLVRETLLVGKRGRRSCCRFTAERRNALTSAASAAGPVAGAAVRLCAARHGRRRPLCVAVSRTRTELDLGAGCANAVDFTCPCPTAASPYPRISMTLAGLSRSDEIVLADFRRDKPTVYETAQESADAVPVSQLSATETRARKRLLGAVMEENEAVNPVIERVTRRIRTRSAATRAAYLARMRHAADDGPARGALSCSNLAHGMAACGSADKKALAGNVVPNIGIVSAYNDMLSAHQPFETLSGRDPGSGGTAGAVAQFAGGVPAMCDGVTQGRTAWTCRCSAATSSRCRRPYRCRTTCSTPCCASAFATRSSRAC